MIEGGLDIALLVILGYFVLRGLFRGVVKEVMAVLGLFVAFWVASVYWPLGDMHLKPIFDMPGHRGISSFLIIFVVVYFLTSLVSIFVDKVVKLTITPVGSGLMGAVAGAIKGILVCGILMSGAQVFLGPSEPFFTSSKIWPYLKPVTSQAMSWMPENLQRALHAKPVTATPARPEGEAQQTVVPLGEVDWKNIQDILRNNPESILPAWREKLQSLSGGEALNPDELKRFISEHPGLFSRSPLLPPGPKPDVAPAGAAPVWPQPAAE